MKNNLSMKNNLFKNSDFLKGNQMNASVKGTGCGGCGCIIMIWLVVTVPMAFWTDRTLDFWLTYWCDKPIDVHFGLSFLASVFGPATFLMNLVSEIARACV